MVGLAGAVVILDLIEQGGDVTAANGGEFPRAEIRREVTIEKPDVLVARAQSIAFDVALEPVVDHGAERLGLWFDCREGSADAVENRTRFQRFVSEIISPGPNIIGCAPKDAVPQKHVLD